MPYDRPSSLDAAGVNQFTGRVDWILVEQVGSRDGIHFRLNAGGEDGFRDLRIFLDEGTTVALAQLHLLWEAHKRQDRVLAYYDDDRFVYALRVPWVGFTVVPF